MRAAWIRMPGRNSCTIASRSGLRAFLAVVFRVFSGGGHCLGLRHGVGPLLSGALRSVLTLKRSNRHAIRVMTDKKLICLGFLIGGCYG